MINEEIQSSEDSGSAIFGKRLGIAMKSLGETKSSLARKTGLSEAAIRNYLKGNSSASIDQLLKITRVTGISAAWFLGEQEDMYVKRDTVEDDLSLLSTLFRHLSEVQRQVVLSQVLTSLAGQYSESYVASDIRKLSSPIIDIALKINKLSDEQRHILEAELGVNDA
ncbi:helix-turn-helix domain-containing protein [Buttiauxella warmboldiae]|uniref:Helix-turn-helix domain-containing protein n=1 Tax=Buttiauxella warmboldiae TaxID=82993 RepID=A0A3N5DHW4_9ENTR|nr:helix-turn-helix domain-containing protein [Buttiauxella warmboldiae]RPH28248.1 helix-turn-helix domain-containing protein [Buttiauxella warmboldiae]